MSLSKKAVMIGAGQYGRGVIAMLLNRAGYDVLLADINMAVINDINERGGYTVKRINKTESEVEVKNVCAISSLDESLPERCAEADIICTCAGLNALEKIAPTVAKSISIRYAKNEKRAINVLACENALGGSTVLKEHVLKNLSEEEKKYVNEYIGFPDCAIDGIIPPVKNALPADVTAEEYYEWDSLKDGFRGELPQIEGLNIVDDLSPYLERKLFTLNGPNAVTGALGYEKGYATVQEALADKQIYDVVWAMMEEAGKMLSKRHGFSDEEMFRYRSFIMDRFLNPNVIDLNVRVVREPIRKLKPNDRIIAPMKYAHSYGIETPAYYKGIAAVMAYSNPDDEQSCEIQKQIKETGFLKTLENITGIAGDSEDADKIQSEFEQLS